MKIARLLVCVIIIVSLHSCKLIGLNVNHDNPRKGNVYPKFTQKDSIRGALTSLRSSFDVQYYDIHIALQPAKKYIQGFVDIEFSVVSATDKIQIDLYENLTLDSILYENKRIPFTRTYGAVYVSFLDSLQKGTEHSIRCFYQGKPVKAKKPPWKGGFVWDKSKDKNPWIGVTCEVDGASLWWPCKDHISDKPDRGVRMNVTVPRGLQVISNGVLQSESHTEQTSHYIWQTNYPINTYNVTLYVGAFQHFSETFKGKDAEFTLDYYMLPEHIEEAKTVFAQTSDVLHFYESIYGPYPWPNEGFKLVGSPYAGMEHQTAIAYGTDFKRQRHFLGFDYIIVHEAAHEWWGNAVSVDDYAEIFIHEGFATYSEMLYVEKTYGTQAAKNYMSFYAMLIKNKNPIVGPRDVNFWNYKDTDPYLKGAWVLHGFRRLLDDDDLFFDIIQGFYAESYLSIVTVADFVAYVNSKTESSYSWYFNQYLYEREVPYLQYAFEQDVQGNVNLYLVWSRVPEGFEMPVRIFVTINSVEYPIVLKPSTDIKKFVLHSCQSVSFDSDYVYYSLKKDTKIIRKINKK